MGRAFGPLPAIYHGFAAFLGRWPRLEWVEPLALKTHRHCDPPPPRRLALESYCRKCHSRTRESSH
jgi:hypothetical protein